jgi:decaprenylphospho-beta-D-erythro-pentofuranosid-2-ulose 2-reductase
MATVLIVGATSGIGGALARELASQGYDMILAGRREDALLGQVRDLELRHCVRVTARVFEASDFTAHARFIASCVDQAEGGLAGIALCFGAMEEEALAAAHIDRALEMIEVNFSSPVSILDRAAEYFESRGEGWICAITSVAGDRGRASNYHYGSTKAGLSAYLSGLRVRMARVGVHVLDVRPGMVDTKLTYGLPGLIFPAAPSLVARDVTRAIAKGTAVLYTPRFWRYIMLGIRLLPQAIFKRLAL